MPEPSALPRGPIAIKATNPVTITVTNGLIFGGTYSLIVLTGVHHSFHAIEAGLIADIGKNYLLPIWSMANVAQGGA